MTFPKIPSVTLEELREQFGDDVAQLVDGVTKLSQLRYGKEQVEAESLRKMFLAMADDIRVVLIKLADRLHNMRTLSVLSRRKTNKNCARDAGNFCARSPTAWASTTFAASSKTFR